MSTLLAFLMTLVQLLAVVVAYIKPYPELFDAVIFYGSPPAIIINIIGASSVYFESNIYFPLIALFHVIKYIALSRSQFVTEKPTLHYVAVIFEILYLGTAAYYLF